MKRGLWLAMAMVFVAAASAQTTGANVDDPYLWLEDVHGAKPLDWVKEQNAKSLALLKADPDYQKDFDAVLAILDATDRIPDASLYRGEVHNFWQDAQHPKGLLRRTSIASYESADPKWDVMLDVDKLAADEHENWVFAGAGATASYKHLLISLSRGGGDANVVREFDPDAKAFVKDGFTLPEAKSDTTYFNENTVLFGTDFGPGSMTKSGYPRIVKIWTRGTQVASAKTVFEGTVDDVAASAFVMRDSNEKPYAFVARALDFFNTEYSFLTPDWSLAKLPLPTTAVVQGMVDGQMLLTLRKDWTYQPATGSAITVPQGALAAFPILDYLKTRAMPRTEILYVPGPRASIQGVAARRHTAFVSISENVLGGVIAFTHDKSGKWSQTRIALPEKGSAYTSSVNEFGPETFYSYQGFLDPPSLYADDGDGNLKKIKSLPARFDASGMSVAQYEAKSSDGTMIPYFVVRKNAGSGPQPTVLYGYGGFEVSQAPWYWATAGKLWLEKGGAIAVANIRGGGEFGPAWHEAALKENRQKAFDDFAAIAADLEKRGLTTPKRLAIMGGSNGGLLVSTVMTQHPELLGAVVCQVPLIDMIRYTQIGAGASWAGEYGDPADPKMHDVILKYSPYQNVSADKTYPPIFFVTATSDDRVTPVHARKMAAKMEAQGHDVLFFENTEGGHAAAADHKQAAEMWALSFVYLKRELGLAHTSH